MFLTPQGVFCWKCGARVSGVTKLDPATLQAPFVERDPGDEEQFFLRCLCGERVPLRVAKLWKLTNKRDGEVTMERVASTGMRLANGVYQAQPYTKRQGNRDPE